jgi:hypothetical protein
MACVGRLTRLRIILLHTHPQARVNASVDYGALEEELFWQLQELNAERGRHRIA